MRNRVTLLTVALQTMLLLACGGRPNPQLDRVEYICDQTVLSEVAYSYTSDGELEEVVTTTYYESWIRTERVRVQYDDGQLAGTEHYSRANTDQDVQTENAIYTYKDGKLDNVEIDYTSSDDVLILEVAYSDDRLDNLTSEFNDASTDNWRKESSTMTYEDDHLVEYECRIERFSIAPEVYKYRLDYSEDGVLSRFVDSNDVTFRFNWAEEWIEDIRMGDNTMRFEYNDDGYVELITGSLFDARKCEIKISYNDDDMEGASPGIEINGLGLLNTMIGVDGKLYNPDLLVSNWIFG